MQITLQIEKSLLRLTHTSYYKRRRTHFLQIRYLVRLQAFSWPIAGRLVTFHCHCAKSRVSLCAFVFASWLLSHSYCGRVSLHVQNQECYVKVGSGIEVDGLNQMFNSIKIYFLDIGRTIYFRKVGGLKTFEPLTCMYRYSDTWENVTFLYYILTHSTLLFLSLL